MYKDIKRHQEYNRKYWKKLETKRRHNKRRKDRRINDTEYREKVRELGRLYYELYKERHNKYRFKKRFEILKKYNFTCQYCGRKAPEVILEIDHIVPKSKGGKNNKINYTIACRDCNIGKGDVLLK